MALAMKIGINLTLGSTLQSINIRNRAAKANEDSRRFDIRNERIIRLDDG